MDNETKENYRFVIILLGLIVAGLVWNQAQSNWNSVHSLNKVSIALPTATSENSECEDGCTEPTDKCKIKGNISFDTGEKIYHVPGDKFYDETVIDPEKGERWFCSGLHAALNGWRQADSR